MSWWCNLKICPWGTITARLAAPLQSNLTCRLASVQQPGTLQEHLKACLPLLAPLCPCENACIRMHRPMVVRHGMHPLANTGVWGGGGSTMRTVCGMLPLNGAVLLFSLKDPGRGCFYSTALRSLGSWTVVASSFL